MKGVWAEYLAEALLDALGYRLLDRRHVVEKGGVKLAEIDILAEKGGERYAVEVKSGRVSTTDVRQAYSNAQLIGAKPLIVARGFADASARAYAEQLGVEVLLYPDYLLAEPEQLHAAVEKAVEKVLAEAFAVNPLVLGDEDLEAVKALAFSRSFEEAARRLGVDAGELSGVIARLREKGAITAKGGYHSLRLQAELLFLATLCVRGLSRGRPF